MSAKRKRVVLTVADKLEILSELKKGASGACLARRYNVGTSTISDIKKQADSINEFASVLDSEDGSLHRKAMKSAQNKDLESAVFKWFMQMRSQGQPISGPIICEKALQMNTLLQGDNEFKATTGWLQRFKSRHGIRELEIQGEKLSADVGASERFKKNIEKVIKHEGFEKGNIYNADETGLYWKQMPTKSLVSKKEMSAPGYKSSKSRITAMVCANYSGTHRLPLLIIGKSKQPRCFKGLQQLPVTYKHQKNSWMDTKTFIDWYENIFIPEVKKNQERTGTNGKVLLVLDNAPSHPSEMFLETEGGKFKIMFLPPNVTSILQPMDQGVIEAFKRFYRKQLLRMLLLEQGANEESIQQLYKKVNLKDGVYMAAEAWESVKEVNLKRAWNKLFPENESLVSPSENNEVIEFAHEVNELIRTAPGFEECDEANLEEWLNCDQEDPGYQILSDDEIVKEIRDTKTDKTNDEEEDEDSEDTEEAIPTHDEAFHCLDTAMRWLERQKESDAVQLLSLKRLRDLAARKRVSNLKQKKIGDYFTKL